MTEEAIKELLNEIKADDITEQLVRAFIKASELKDYSTMRKMNNAKLLVDSKISFIRKLGIKKSLEIMKQTDYMYWEYKHLSEVL